MRTGIMIMSAFALVWAVLALLGMDGPPWLGIVPAAITAGIVWAGWRRLPPSRDANDPEEKRVGRLVAVWSAIEGAGIFLAIFAVQLVGHPEAVLPAIAVVVGLHFLPLARGLPRPSYYLTGAALIVAGAIGEALPAAQIVLFTGLTAAVILWLTCLGLLFGRAGQTHGARAA